MKTNNYLWSMLVTATFVLTGCGSDENGITAPPTTRKDSATGTVSDG